MRSHVLVLYLNILTDASNSHTISWVHQNLSGRVLNDSRDLAITTVSGRLFHGLVTWILNTCNDNAGTKMGVVVII